MEYAGEITADLYETYGIDIRKVMTGEIPAAIALSLIEHLPQGSRFRWQAAGCDPQNRWSKTDELIVELIDSLQINTISTGHYKRQPEFTPYPRPWASQSDTGTADDMFNFLSGMLADRGPGG